MGKTLIAVGVLAILGWFYNAEPIALYGGILFIALGIRSLLKDRSMQSDCNCDLCNSKEE